jgi:hypothetical protein
MPKITFISGSGSRGILKFLGRATVLLRLGSRHSLDLDRALALNLRPALRGQLLVVEIDPGVIQGSWSKSMIMIKSK